MLAFFLVYRQENQQEAQSRWKLWKNGMIL